MNRILSFTFKFTATIFAALLAGGAAAQSSSNSLLFRNGDLLYGQLLAIDPQNSLRWQHPDARGPIDFKPDSVQQIDFPAATNSVARPENACRVLLTDGDSLDGSFVSCDRANLVLQTWYAGRLSIPRSALQLLVFVPTAPLVFDGITGLDGWTQAVASAAIPGETGHWVYRNGAFYAGKSASIARNLHLPDVAEIQFDMAWRGSLNLAVALYTDSLQPILVTAKDAAPDFGGFYSLRFQTSFAFSIDMWPIKKSERLRSLGQLFVPSLNNKDRVHVDLYISKPQHKMALSLDDVPIKVWDDPEGFIGEGTGVRLVQNPGSVLKLSNLRVTQWDGIFPEISGDVDATTEDVIWPENRTKVAGTVESILNGKLTARTSNGTIEIPAAQVKSIEFAHQAASSTQIQPATVRGTFAQGGALTFILDRWRPDGMVVHSPKFGKATFNPTAFIRLQFLYPENKPVEGPKG